MKKKEIMIVDDEPEIVDMMKIMLESAGYGTIECYSGKECLDKLLYKKPSLILLDIMMEPMDGWETLETIKKDDKLKKIPVCVVSIHDCVASGLDLKGKGKNEDILRKIENQMTKPFTKNDLIEMIQDVFKKGNT